LPQSDGGSPVLGFKVFMKGAMDSDYTQLDVANEDPTVLSLTITKNHNG